MKKIPIKALAKVSILKGGNNKTVGIKVKTKNNPKDGYYISSIITNPTVLNITGQRSTLANLGYLETEELDLTDIQDKMTKEVQVILPDGVSVQKGGTNKISVEINVAQLSASKPVIPSIVTTGLADGLKVSSISPNDIKINLSGPSTVLNEANTNNVKLNIDLSGKPTGTYNINVNSQMITLPTGISITSIVPTSLSITISN